MFKNNEATLIIIFLIFSIVSTFAIVVWHGWIVDTDQKYSYAYIHSYTQKKYLSVNLIGVGKMTLHLGSNFFSIVNMCQLSNM